jgi:hypothetical protein
MKEYSDLSHASISHDETCGELQGLVPMMLLVVPTCPGQLSPGLPP